MFEDIQAPQSVCLSVCLGCGMQCQAQIYPAALAHSPRRGAASPGVHPHTSIFSQGQFIDRTEDNGRTVI